MHLVMKYQVCLLHGDARWDGRAEMEARWALMARIWWRPWKLALVGLAGGWAEREEKSGVRCVGWLGQSWREQGGEASIKDDRLERRVEINFHLHLIFKI
jgi:hypothetical protein